MQENEEDTSVPDCTNCEMLQETVSKEKEKFRSQEMEYLDEIRQLKEIP